MNRALGFVAVAWIAFMLPADRASAQAYGPLDNRVGGSGGGPAAVLPDSRVDSRTDSRARSPGSAVDRAPQGYTATRNECYKDGKLVDRAYCESDPFYRPDRPAPGMGYYSQRCSNNNTNYNPVTKSYIGLDGIQRYCN